ncbi:MAG: KpsF/GutQ family sugar-phosphate isomerase [Alphaproteobacteria bacterium]|nr:KpsF/GutQ family sugar-phosphate isomerase [Alphaproteobacteria bacterium]
MDRPMNATPLPKDQQETGTESAALRAGRRALAIEAAGLEALARALDGAFEQAVEALAGTRGRVVVSGMGKSGHVARKIAATLASTGKPAFFVHPAEASHGDLGMIATGDAVICLSFSGDTAELADIVNYCKRFTIPLIGVVGRAESALGRAADIVLLLPAATEACPMGLAPTTSTTMMLALGDALAVALLERQGFSRDQFRIFHPGGKLGQRLIRVGDIMHDASAVPLVVPDAAMTDAILVMTQKSFGCVGVVDEAGRLAGIITDGDLRRHMGERLLMRLAGDVMTRHPQTIGPDALAQEALARMNGRNITSLFVTDRDGRPVGILHIHDCLRAGVA